MAVRRGIRGPPYVFRHSESVYDVYFSKFNHFSRVLLIGPFTCLGAFISGVSVLPNSRLFDDKVSMSGALPKCMIFTIRNAYMKSLILWLHFMRRL